MTVDPHLTATWNRPRAKRARENNMKTAGKSQRFQRRTLIQPYVGMAVFSHCSGSFRENSC